MTGITGDAVGAALVAGKTVGKAVWFVDTGVVLAGRLLGPVGNVQADKYGRRWLAGTVSVEIGTDVVVAKGDDAEAVTGGAFVPWGVVVDWATWTWSVFGR